MKMAGTEKTLLTAILNPFLASLWAHRHVFFLWSTRGSRAVWTNREGLRLWQRPSLHALATQTPDPTVPWQSIDRIARYLPTTHSRIERIRFYLDGRDLNLSCQCEWMDLNDEHFMLVHGLDLIPSSGPARSSARTDHDDAVSLIDGLHAPLLAFTSTGKLLLANASATTLLDHSPHPKHDQTTWMDALGRQAIAIIAGHHDPQDTSTVENINFLQKIQVFHLDGHRNTLALALLREAPDSPDACSDQTPSHDADTGTSGTKELLSLAAYPFSEHPIEHDAIKIGAARPLNENGKTRTGLEKVANVFPFTGVPVRIREESSQLEPAERDSFREIARALGARIEGDPDDMSSSASPLQDENISNAILPPANDDHAASWDEIVHMLDRIPSGILIYRDEQPVYANHNFLNLFGYASFEDLSQSASISDFLPQIMHNGPDGTIGSARLQAIQWAGQRAMLLNVHRDTATNTGRADPCTQSGPYGETTETTRIRQLSRILAFAVDGLVTIDQSGFITHLSDQTTGLLNCAPHDWIGQPLETLFTPASQTIILECLDNARRSNTNRNDSEHRVSICKTDGNELTFTVRIRPMDDDPNGYWVILHRVDDSKQYETDLIAARKAAEAENEQKSNFLAKASHEIRTPLNSIIGFAEMILEKDLSCKEQERFLSYVRDIHSSGKYLLCLVNDLLDLSKIEAGKQVLNVTNVNVNEIARHSLDMLQPDAIRNRIILRQNLSHPLPDVRADRRCLHQILLNLLSNAIKFNKPGGQVLISTNITSTNAVRIRVRDTGIGMTPQQLDGALEAFCQVHAPVFNQKVTGTGLGLPLAKALTEANKGFFSLSSAPQKGTLAEITFPETSAFM